MNDRLTILCGDVLEKLRELPDESVQCCVTSPPFWGLRDYGTAKWDGGNDGCDHLGPPRMSEKTGLSHPELKPREQILAEPSRLMPTPYRGDCGKCGARRIDAQLGLEKTPEEYVAKMVAVFREVRRVLRKDGTLWLNLGDSYHGSWGNSGSRPELDGKSQNQRDKTADYLPRGGWDERRERPASSYAISGLKPKDLVGIPWMVAFALRADGWWLRSDIIWAKPNPMPESVTDRPTKSHEYIFLLTKSAKYFYDAGAIQEATSYEHRRSTTNVTQNGTGRNDAEKIAGDLGIEGYRNKRSVWTVTTQPYPEAHFATYPPDLIKPCIMAGSKVGDSVLDPFAGSGTTGLVSVELGRKAILIELNPKYVELIEQRTDVTPGLALA